MTTVAKLIEYLQTCPQDAIVECGREVTSGYSTYMEMVAVDIESCHVFDYTSEADRKNYQTMAGKVIVALHGE